MSRSGLLHAAAEGKFPLLGHGMNEGYLGGGDIIGIHPANALSLAMDFQHDSRRFRCRLVKNRHQDFHDEVHGRIVVIVKDNSVHLRFMGIRFSVKPQIT
jgi:hypothetical protein